MRSIYRYPGSKAKLLPQILPFIDASLKEASEGFVDAFVGGGSVLLAVAEKYPQLQLYANDKDLDVSAFWEIMSRGTNSELSELKRLLEQKPTTALYYELRQKKPASISMVEAAYQAIFFNRTSFSGDMRHAASPIGGKNQSSKYTVDCRYNTKKLLEQVDAIHKLLKGRVIVSPYDINSYDAIKNEKLTLYIDPPYVIKGNMLYEERMNSSDHLALSKTLSNRKNWILSYDNCPQVLELYDWANINLIDVAYCIKGAKTNWQNTKEVLILPNSF